MREAMKRIESPLDHARGTVTYELPDGRWATFDARERVPVFQYGRRIGTMPPDFDPTFARSNSFVYDLRPGDFTRNKDGWIVGRTMGASDVDCVVGFIREHR